MKTKIAASSLNAGETAKPSPRSTRKKRQPTIPAKAAVNTTSLIENQDFVSDFARFSESILDEKFLRRKYKFDNSVWEKLGSDERLIEAIEYERVKRMRNGDSAREKAQQIFVAAPSVLGGILNDNGANARHRIESARELRTIANVRPQAVPSADMFQIVINLGSDTEVYSKPRAVGLDDTGTRIGESIAIDVDDPGHVDTATLAAITIKNSSGNDSDGGRSI